MKKLSIVLLSIFVATFAIQAKAKKVKEEKKTEPKWELVTDVDSASYAMGVYIGKQSAIQLSSQDFNIDLFVKAFVDAVYDAPLMMSADSSVVFLNAYEKKVREQEAEMRKKQQADFLQANALREDVKQTASGLQYMVVKMTEGEKPVASSKVKVHYEGFLLDGKKFDSSVDRGKPAEFALNRVIKGWTEGLQLMPVGSKFTFYIPYELAYGAQGAGNAVPPYSTLIFEVELLDIIK